MVLLFDADNTILDFSACEHEIITGLVEDLDLPDRTDTDEDPVSAYRRINSRLWELLELGEIKPEVLKIERFRQFLLAFGLKNRYDPSEINRLFIEKLSRCGALVTGALETITRYRPIHIITNGFSEVQRRRMEAAGIAEDLANLFISEEIGYAKPDKRFFDYVLKRLGSPNPSECLVIGDSISSDIQGGINAGLPTCWLDRMNRGSADIPEELQPNFRITSLGELPSIIGR